MNRRALRLAPFAAAVALTLFGCNERSAPPSPATVPSATVPSAAVAPSAVPPPTPSATPAAKPPAPRPDVVWLVVSRAGVDLGLIELRRGKGGVLTLESESERARALQTLWTKLEGPDGIAVDMHLPPESGEGRGAYGARVFRPGEDDYPMAVEQKLIAAALSVERVPALGATPRATSLRKLKIARSGAPVGTLDFTSDPPTLSIETTKSDGDFLKSHWEEIARQERVKVRFLEPKNGIETLAGVEAKRGDAGYPDAVRLYLILRHQYDAQRGYTLEGVP